MVGGAGGEFGTGLGRIVEDWGWGKVVCDGGVVMVGIGTVVVVKLAILRLGSSLWRWEWVWGICCGWNRGFVRKRARM